MLAVDAFSALPNRRLTRRERGSSLWAKDLVAGVQLGAFPDHCLLVAEGPLAPMLSGDEYDSGLADPATLVLGAQRAREAFSAVGISLDCDAVVRRLDLAGDLRFDPPAGGLRFLVAMTALNLPRHRQRIEKSEQTGEVTSLTWLSGGKVALRLYDAGLHHGTDAPGVLVRLERQVRYPKRDQRPARAIAESDLPSLYLGPLRRLIDAAPSLAVTTPRAAELLLLQRYEADAITLTVLERSLGALRILELRIEGDCLASC